MNQPDNEDAQAILQMAETCAICYGKGYVYTSRYNAGWFKPCPNCGVPAPRLPWWLRAEGHSILHPTLRDSDGGAMQVGDQT